MTSVHPTKKELPAQDTNATLVLGEDSARWVHYNVKGEQAEILSEEVWHWTKDEVYDQTLVFWLKERCKRDRLSPDQIQVLLADGSIHLRHDTQKTAQSDPARIYLKPIVTAPDRFRSILNMLHEAGVESEQIRLKEHALFEALCYRRSTAAQNRTVILLSLEPGVLTVTLARKDALLSARRVPTDTGDCDLASARTRKLILKDIRSVVDYERTLTRHPIDMIYLATDEPEADTFCEYLTSELEIPTQTWELRDLDFLALHARHENPSIKKLREDLKEVFWPQNEESPKLINQMRKNARPLILGALILALYLGVMFWSLLRF